MEVPTLMTIRFFSFRVAQNVHFGWNEKVIGFVQSLKYYDSIVKKEAEKGIAAYSFSASFIYTY